MTKIDLSTLGSLTNEQTAISTINANSVEIEDTSDDFLSRTGVAPNSMEASLDMNSNRILNLIQPVAGSEPVIKTQLDAVLAKLASTEVLSAASVRTFGAKGDGVTDDTLAIIAACQSASALGGGMVNFPPGTYMVSRSGGTSSAVLLENLNNITLIGAGIGATTIKMKPGIGGMLISLIRCNDVAIKNMTLDGGVVWTGTTLAWTPTVVTESGHGIRAEDVNRLLIEEVHVKNTYSYGGGFQAGYIRNLTVNNCKFENTGADGIDFKNILDINDQNVISNTVIKRWGMRPDLTLQTGIDCRGPVICSNITMFDPGANSCSGWRCRTGEAGGGGNGLGGHRSSLTGYYIDMGAAATGIGISLGSRDVNFSDGIVLAGWRGLQPGTSQGLAGANCKFEGQSDIAVNILATCDGTRLTGCKVKNAGQTAFQSASADVSLIAPEVDGAGTAFVADATASNFKVFGPTSKNLTVRAINTVAGSSGFFMRDGQFIGAGANIVVVDNGTGTIVVNSPGLTNIGSDIPDASTTVKGVVELATSAETTTGTDTVRATTPAGVKAVADLKQNLDATLTALSAYNTNGVLTQTAADTFVGRTITGTTDKISVTNGDGVAGNPTISLPNNIVVTTSITVPNTGLLIADTAGSDFLTIKPGTNLSVNRTLTLTTGDADRTLTMTADSSIGGTAYVVGGTDVPITDGGTGSSTAAGAATNLGLGTGDSPQFTAVNVGDAADTTLARSSAGNLSVEGNLIYRAGGTDVPLTDGGTGASDASTARTNLGLAIGTNVQAFDAQLFSNIPQNSQIAAYTTVLTDGNKHIYHPSSDNNARTFTIDSNVNVAYPIGTTITFVNEINTVTIAITSDTLTLAGLGSTGSRTLAANGIATAMKVASTKWVISGTGLT